MALTLANAKKLSQDKLTGYVIDEFRKSPLLDSMPFDNCVTASGGNTLAYVYNRVTTMGTANTRAINSEYTPQEAITEQYTANLKVLGGSFELDRVIIENEKAIADHVLMQLEQKTQATVALFHDLFINGDSGSVSTQFDGLDVALASSDTEINAGGSAINLSSSANINSNWQAFLDSMRKARAALNGAPTVVLMSNDMYAVFQSVMDRAGINLVSKDNYGFETSQWGPALVMAMGDKPGSSDPIIPTSGGETSIYFARLALDGVHGVSPSGNKLVKQYIPDLTTPGAVKLGEVEMVAAIALKATKAAGVLRKIKIA